VSQSDIDDAIRHAYRAKIFSKMIDTDPFVISNERNEMPVRQSLEAAVGRAVKEGQEAAGKLQAKFDLIRLEMWRAIELVSPWTNFGSAGDLTTKNAAAAFSDLLAIKSAEIHQLFETQRASLGTLNLAFFGRTGVGKSSLIEALTSGDGESVSSGESDWTVEVRPVDWSGCRLLDTPGINGWGRTKNRMSLEEQARKAVEIADIVLLCFDSQSQQETEFEKVASWIKAYGKPVIAVLNCRNPEWRFPPRVERASRRKIQSQAVHEHEGNICDGLTNLGFSGIPVVSFSAKRALMARGKEPFKGPDAKTFARYRQEFGTEALLKWSNLPALESLIIEALEVDASGIRLGMLMAEVRGVLAKLYQELDNIVVDTKKLADMLDNTVDTLLKVLGYPPFDIVAREPFRDPRVSVDLIKRLEQLRGGKFQAPTEGEFQIFCKQMLTAHLGKIRSRSLDKAEDLVLSAFNEHREVDGEAFVNAVYDRRAIDLAANEVLDEAGKFLKRKVRLTLQDSESDIACTFQAADGIEGTAGQAWGWVGKGARGAGILAGGASPVILALAAATSWNPAGWVLATISVGSALFSWLSSWVGSRAERAAEDRRSSTRREALASARQNVNQTFDRFTTKVAEAAASTGRAAMAEVLLPQLRDAVAARLILEASARAGGYLEKVEGELPCLDPQKILGDAARAIERRLHPDNPAAGHLIWSGDNWVTDPLGLVAQTGSARPARASQGQSSGERSGDTLRDAFNPDRPKAGEGKAWLHAVREVADQLPGGEGLLAELERLAATSRPTLYIIGDYNSGKTSFIKRLLVDASQPIPANAEVRADPTTREITEYEWEKMLLVDTPGLQSLRNGDTQLSMGAFPDASYLVCLLQPNLLNSTLDLICPVLIGDKETGLAPKLFRTIFIINRADELGPDPMEDLVEYEMACRRKQVEVLQALKRRSVELSKDRIICMASDPYGRVGDRRDVNAHEFDEFRAWDGVSTFLRAVRRTTAKALRIGVDASVLEGGLARLGGLRSSACATLSVVRLESDVLHKVADRLEAAEGEGQRLQGHIEGKLDRLLDEATEGHVADAMGASNDLELEQAAAALAAWWEDKGFTDSVDRWQDQSRGDIELWFHRTLEEIGRSMDSIEFSRAFPETKAAYIAERFSSQSGNRKQWWDVLATGVKSGGQRDIVYGIGKFFGVKFRPWGAVNAAAKIAKAGALLAVVGVGLDVLEWVRSAKARRRKERARKDAAKFLRESRDEIRASLLGGEETEMGPSSYLKNQLAGLRQVRDEVIAEMAGADMQLNILNKQLAALDAVMSGAWARLATTAETETGDE
jgi:predicted GTPase